MKTTSSHEGCEWRLLTPPWSSGRVPLAPAPQIRRSCSRAPAGLTPPHPMSQIRSIILYVDIGRIR